MPDTVPDTVLVADRGVAAVRVVTALERHGTKAVSVHTAADATALHAFVADESVLLGDDLAAYDDVRKLVEAARQIGAGAVHPGGRELPGLAEAVVDAGLAWLGGDLSVPATVVRRGGVVEAAAAEVAVSFTVLPARAVEVVTGLDLTVAALDGADEGVARPGVAVSVDVLAEVLAPVTGWQVPEGDDVWVDAAVREGSDPVDPLLAVLTVWGEDRENAYARALLLWDLLVVEGPSVRRPDFGPVVTPTPEEPA